MNLDGNRKEGTIPISTSDRGRADRLSRWLIRHAAHTAPMQLSERLEEEWLADIAQRSSPMSRLRFALGCLWATRVIAHDHAIATMPVNASAAPAGAIAPGTRPTSNLFSRRTTTFAFVALLHVAVFYAFMTGLSSSLIKSNTAPLQNRVLNEIRPRDLPPPPPPNLNPVKLEMPKFDQDLSIRADSPQEVVQTDAPLAPLSPPPLPPPVMPVHEATMSQAGPGLGFPIPDDYYPSISKHLEEQGAVTVRACVDAAGRLTNDPTIAATSGNARLDDGALKLARAGSGHYRAATEDGRPVNSCYSFRVRFQIKN